MGEEFERFAGKLWTESAAQIAELIVERDNLKGRVAALGAVDSPVETKERATLLTIIAALASEAKIDWQKPSKAAGLIQPQTEKLGAALGQRTIEEHLKRIPAALLRRAK